MIVLGNYVATEPSVGIFWMVGPSAHTSLLVSEGYPVAEAEPYGDFLIFSEGHYPIWEKWRKHYRSLPGPLRSVVQLYEYEDWPRGRIGFDQVNNRFIVYADRKLLDMSTILQIAQRFALPADQLEAKADFHYQSRETPGTI